VTRRLAARELHEYLLVLGGALVKYGCPTHRLEAVIREVAALSGYRADAFGTLTGLFVSLDDPEAGPTLRMIRVNVWGTDLGRLSAVDRIFNDVLAERYDLAEAKRRLDALERRPPLYPIWAVWLASAGASAAAAVFFRGGWPEVLVGALGGLLVGVIVTLARRNPRTVLLADFLGGLVAGLLAWAATWIDFGILREVVVLATIISLVPGMGLTAALSELANRNLVSGGARLMDAMMGLLSIVFGIAVAVTLERVTGWAPPVPHDLLVRTELGLPIQLVALLLAGFSFSLGFAVPRSLLHLSMLAAALAWVVTTLGLRYLPGALAAFSASAAVALLSNGLARAIQQPAQLFLVPGLILMVPGSLGFRSLEMFLRGQFLDGAARGFDMFLNAGAIVVGMLVANVVLPARKIL
jgi:uncharacterized membrane protein YjjP (DUF1212 family)